jgi:hypothetical protein
MARKEQKKMPHLNLRPTKSVFESPFGPGKLFERIRFRNTKNKIFTHVSIQRFKKLRAAARFVLAFIDPCIVHYRA